MYRSRGPGRTTRGGAVARTQEQRKADTRDRLLRAAGELFARDGYHAVSIDAVADAADRTSGAVYNHFGGKEGLLLALVDAFEQQAAGQVGEALASEADLRGRLAALWGAFATRADEPDAWMLLEHELWLYAGRNPEVSGRVAARYRGGRRGMAASFERWCDAEGVEPPLPPDELATVVLGLLFGLEMIRRVDPGAVPDRLPQRALDVLFAQPPRARATRPPHPNGRGNGSPPRP
jgi:AcrR family transcriptional regulator